MKTNIVNKIKQSYTSKNFKNGAYSSVIVIAILIVVVLINVIGSEFDLKKDVSSESVFTLTDQTKEVVGEVQDEITLYYVTQSGEEFTTIQNIINKYDALSDKINVVMKDPVLYPSFVNEYIGVNESVESNSVVVENTKTGVSKYIPLSDMLEMDYTNYYYGYTSSPELTAIDVEGQITGAIQYVSNKNNAKLYQVSGHGETEISDYLKNEFTKLCTEVETLETRTITEIPKDCTMLLICGPVTDYTEEEVTMIEEYMGAGGNVIVMTNFQADQMTNFNKLLSDYGLKLSEGIVLEDSSHSAGNYPYYIFPNVLSHEVTEGVARTTNPVALLYAQALTEQEKRDTVTITPLLQTSDNSYCKTEKALANTLEKEDSDEAGSAYTGVLVTETKDGVESNMAVFSSMYLVADDFLQYSSYGNATMISNVVSFMNGQETGLSIPKRNMQESYISTTESQVVCWTVILVVVLPVMIVCCGGFVWYRRRKQ